MNRRPMSNIDKLKSAAAKAVDNFDPNMFVETRDVLALLDELEAAEKRIAELESDLSEWTNCKHDGATYYDMSGRERCGRCGADI